MELNIEQIVKALECCSKHPMRCEKCPYLGVSCCTNEHRKDALSLIRELTKENGRLKSHINRLKKYDEERDIALHARLIANTKAATVRKMQERLKKKSEIVYGDRAVCVELVDQIAKEVLEGTQ